MARTESYETTMAVYEAIIQWWENHEYGPTIRDLVKVTGMSSTSVVNHHLMKLLRDGYVVREDGKARTLRPVGIRIKTPSGVRRV